MDHNQGKQPCARSHARKRYHLEHGPGVRIGTHADAIRRHLGQRQRQIRVCLLLLQCGHEHRVRERSDQRLDTARRNARTCAGGGGEFRSICSATGRQSADCLAGHPFGRNHELRRGDTRGQQPRGPRRHVGTRISVYASQVRRNHRCLRFRTGTSNNTVDRWGVHPIRCPSSKPRCADRGCAGPSDVCRIDQPRVISVEHRRPQRPRRRRQFLHYYLQRFVVAGGRLDLSPVVILCYIGPNGSDGWHCEMSQVDVLSPIADFGGRCGWALGVSRTTRRLGVVASSHASTIGPGEHRPRKPRCGLSPSARTRQRDDKGGQRCQHHVRIKSLWHPKGCLLYSGFSGYSVLQNLFKAEFPEG